MSTTTMNEPARQTLGFQAEVKQLLHLMVHSLYSNKEIFLRELVSNASDACDKLRFEALARPELLDGDADLAIDVAYDKTARTITVSDNGIGMSRDEAIAQLGTIAKSGTREFFASLTGDQQKDAQLIGQFGVGFYSSFIVADRVSVVSRRAGSDDAIRWESDGGGEFTIEPATRARRGTDVTLHLKEGEDELLSSCEAARDPQAVLGSHRDADPDEEGGMGQGQEANTSRRTRPRRSIRRARSGRGRSPRSATSNIRSSTSTSATTSPIRSHGRTTASKARPNTSSSCTCRRRRRSTCGTASTATA